MSLLDAPADCLALATAQVDAVAEAYARATEIVRPLMEAAPDGHIVVGAMDGWTVVVPTSSERMDAVRGR